MFSYLNYFAIYIHCSGSRFPCTECEHSAKTVASLTRHRMIVHEGVRFQCFECEFKSTTSSHLKEHRKIKHEGNVAKCYKYLILISNIKLLSELTFNI